MTMTVTRLSRHAAKLIVAIVMAFSQEVRAQSKPQPSGALFFPRLAGPVDDAFRRQQLTDNATSTGWLLRSASSLLTHALDADSARRSLAFLSDAFSIDNSALPLSLNDGALWAGRGENARVMVGLHYSWRDRVRVLLAPELLYSTNRDYDLWDPALTTPPPPTRNPYSSPWHAGPLSIDLPLRFGNRIIRTLDPGQSAVIVPVRNAELGFATENEWWGPGIQNALVMSSNAPGFLHAFARTRAPWKTRVGDFEARWIVGALRESSFFDFNSANNLRSISSAAVTWRLKWVPDLTLGIARSVYAPARKWTNVAGDFWQIIADVGRPNARPASDSTPSPPGRDQLLSLFARWVFPDDHAEIYGEWGRVELPVSLRDLIIEPAHTQGYLLGGQWMSDPTYFRGRVRVQAEATYIEQSTTYRYRPQGSWYASRAVQQGYTNDGQPIGAAIGPGASSQHVGLDFVTDRWLAGAFLGRIRWMDDAHAALIYPTRVGWCEEDVSILQGFQGQARTKFGVASAWFSSGWRLNPFFKYYGRFCPEPPHADVRNRTLSLTFAPAALRF